MLGFWKVERVRMPHLYTDDDRGRWIKRATATLTGGRLHTRLFNGCSACMHVHCIALCISDRSSSNDRTSLVGGALERPFQLLRDQIDHHRPPSTAVVWEEEHSPNSKKAKTRIKRCQALRLGLRPCRTITPSRILTRARGSMQMGICVAF